MATNSKSLLDEATGGELKISPQITLGLVHRRRREVSGACKSSRELNICINGWNVNSPMPYTRSQEGLNIKIFSHKVAPYDGIK